MVFQSHDMISLEHVLCLLICLFARGFLSYPGEVYVLAWICISIIFSHIFINKFGFNKRYLALLFNLLLKFFRISERKSNRPRNPELCVEARTDFLQRVNSSLQRNSIALKETRWQGLSLFHSDCTRWKFHQQWMNDSSIFTRFLAELTG